MIASFEHNFIFIKTRKTAGTSVEIVLSSWCGNRDVVTPIAWQDELIRIEYGGLPRNFGIQPELEADFANALQKRDADGVQRLHRLIKPRRSGSGFYNHMPAYEVRAKLPELWENAFTFTVERHPYEKIVSRAHWQVFVRGGDRPIARVIDELIDNPKVSDKSLYSDKDKVIVDKIIDYDRLWPEMEALAKKFDKQLPPQVPRAKGESRKDRRPAREQLSGDQKRRIAERFAFEFELMGFEP